MVNFQTRLTEATIVVFFILLIFTAALKEPVSEYSLFEALAPWYLNLSLSGLLAYMMLFNRPYFVMGLIAGALWLLLPAFVDKTLAPYWVATMAYAPFLLNNGQMPAEKAPYRYLRSWAIATLVYHLVYSSDNYFTFLAILPVIYLVFSHIINAFINEEEDHETQPPRRQDTAFSQEYTVSHRESHAKPPPVTQPAKQQTHHEAPHTISARPFEAEVIRLDSIHSLPDNLHCELQGIIKYTRLIQECILTDPRDVESSTAFLRRYLPATLEIVEKGYGLSQKLKKYSNDQELNQRKAEILHALHCAFRQKYVQLLENDKMELTTEISTLEKLLKTDGFL